MNESENEFSVLVCSAMLKDKESVWITNLKSFKH